MLGAILLDNAALHEATEYVQPRSFFLSQHFQIFKCMLELSERQQPIDTTLLMNALQSSGQLEAAGGAGYLSQLADGLPKSTNVAHYARIVASKFQIRQIVHQAYSLQENALASDARYEDLAEQAESIARNATMGQSAKLATIDANDFLAMQLPELEYVIQPLLTVRGRGMIFSPRGLGKTFVTLGIAHCIATGVEDCFVWRVAKPRKVIYIDGEMHAAQLQQRVNQIFSIYHRTPEPGYLRLITRDLQKNARPKINTAEGRRQIESHLQPGCVNVLDNLSALAPSGDEAETDEWAEIEDWLINLSWQGVSTIFVHHAGKSGQQRGTSKREDLLDFVLELRRPSNHSVEEGLRVEAHLTKVRGQIPDAKWGAPFEIVLRENEWLTRPLKGVLRDRAKLMLDSGMKASEVAQEIGLSRYQVYRIQKSMKDGTSELIDL